MNIKDLTKDWNSNLSCSYWIYGLVILFALLSHIHSLSNEFALDDLIHLVGNPSIASLAHIEDLFRAPLYPGNLYRPILTLSYALTYSVFGAAPLPYHLTNLFLHSGVALLLFQLSRRWLPTHTALLVTALYTSFPIHTEAVANVSGRAELLAAFFGVLYIHLGVKEEQRISAVILSTLCLLVALLSKESALIFPGLLFLISYFHGKRFSMRNALIALTAYALYFTLRWQALGWDIFGSVPISTLDNPLASLPPVIRSVVSVALLGYYAALTFFPIHLSADYSYAVFAPLLQMQSFSFYFGFFLALSLVAIAIKSKSTEVRLGITWFFLAFLITSNIGFPIGTIFGERLAYLPSIGLALAISPLLRTNSAKSCAIGILPIFLAINWVQDGVWRNSSTLWNAQISISPESAKTQANYGIALRNSGDLLNADLHLRKALEIYPHYAEAAYGVGTIYAAKNMLSGAAHWFHEALKIDPAFSPALISLGRLDLNEGVLESAQKKFEKVLVKENDNVEALIGLYGVAIAKGEHTRANEIELRLEKLASYNLEFVRLKERRVMQRAIP